VEEMSPVARGVIEGMQELIVGKTSTVDTDLGVLNSISKMLAQPEKIRICKSRNN